MLEQAKAPAAATTRVTPTQRLDREANTEISFRLNYAGADDCQPRPAGSADPSFGGRVHSGKFAPPAAPKILVFRVFH
jgi:hypothetical protein